MAISKRTSGECFGKYIEEQNNVDFPYYNGKPTVVETWKWVAAWLGTFLGFLTLSFYPATNNVELLVPRFMFMAIPLIIFAYLTKQYWKALFKRPRKIDFVYMFLFAGLNMILTPILAVTLLGLGIATSGNAVGDGLVGTSALELIAFYVGTGIQLLGEEILVIVPFLAILSTLHLKFGISRKKAILWAWFISALWFGAIHFPTYQWNIIQALVVIGGARIALTLAFIRTKNLWVSTGAHVINDWVLFTAIMLAAMTKG